MASSKPNGLARLVHAFGYSCAGLKAAYQSEVAFRQELLLSKKAKDLGSATVMLALITAASVWAIILI